MELPLARVLADMERIGFAVDADGIRAFGDSLRGELDGIQALVDFADKLEAATIATIEGGVMTKDLVGLWEGETSAQGVNSLNFLKAIRAKLEETL